MGRRRRSLSGGDFTASVESPDGSAKVSRDRDPATGRSTWDAAVEDHDGDD
jgi:hypothetical protein